MRRVAVPAIILALAAADARAESALEPQAVALALAHAAFAPGPAAAEVDPIDRLLDKEVYARSQGFARWSSREVQISGDSVGPIDRLRLSVGEIYHGPSLQGGSGALYQLTYEHNWPGLNFGAGRFSADFSPHAGVGLGSLGGLAEAGATLRISKSKGGIKDAARERLKNLGVRDGSVFGDRGRWYIFAAASGKAVGLNLLHRESGWDRAGWSTDPTSQLVSDAQLGVGWRKGPLQTSLGFVQRDVKSEHLLLGVDPRPDSMMAFSLSIKPPR